MNDRNGSKPTTRARAHALGTVLVEAVIIGIAGAILGFAANSVSPFGLKLRHDYFPGAIRSSALVVMQATNVSGGAHLITNATALVAARLKMKGLKGLTLEQVSQLYYDVRRLNGLIVFVDARDEKQYQAGHIPGAFLFDHYHAEQYLPIVLPVCMGAEQVVLYCYGGECEDSEFAAVILREAGVSNDKLNIYMGGFTEWATNGLPIEHGPQRTNVTKAMVR